jgi:hypothetical protein
MMREANKDYTVVTRTLQQGQGHAGGRRIMQEEQDLPMRDRGHAGGTRTMEERHRLCRRDTDNEGETRTIHTRWIRTINPLVAHFNSVWHSLYKSGGQS